MYLKNHNKGIRIKNRDRTGKKPSVVEEGGEEAANEKEEAGTLRASTDECLSFKNCMKKSCACVKECLVNL